MSSGQPSRRNDCMRPAKFGFGQPVRRKEDEAFLRGSGRYVADFAPQGLCHAAVLRSPHAHARFRIENAAAARGMPGVRLVLTAADAAELGFLPCTASVPDQTIAVPPYPIVANGEALHVGDCLAFVVADTLFQAQDAVEAIALECEALPCVVDGRAALADGAPRVATGRAGNLAYETSIGDAQATRSAFAAARHRVSLNLVNQRLVANYLDTRGVIGEYDPARDRITLTLSSQGGHAVRDMLCEPVLKIPAERMRVITPDVGGGFGTKLFPYREYALAAVAAKRLRRPVKWVAGRTEHFLGDAHGRDNVTLAELALDEEARFLALRVDTIANLGAYLSCYAPLIPYLGAGMLPGVYDIPVCHVRVRAAYTNTLPVDAYRGAGRPEAAYVIERLVDAAARDLGIAPATYIEACGGNGPENAKLRLEADGGVELLIGTQSTGQGHHTAYAQLVADHLDLPPQRVRVVQGDTDLIATGGGTGGSSSIPCGGASVAGAARKLAANLKTLAADALEASPADLEIAGGEVRIVGTDRSIAFAAIAKLPGADVE